MKWIHMWQGKQWDFSTEEPKPNKMNNNNNKQMWGKK